ncbi:hypothetical protein AAY473_007209, partial [Plecturocebus cupreus]
MRQNAPSAWVPACPRGAETDHHGRNRPSGAPAMSFQERSFFHVLPLKFQMLISYIQDILAYSRKLPRAIKLCPLSLGKPHSPIEFRVVSAYPDYGGYHFLVPNLQVKRSEMGFRHVSQAALELQTLGDLPTPASQRAGIAGGSPRTRPKQPLLGG